MSTENSNDKWWEEGHVLRLSPDERFIEECRQSIDAYTTPYLFNSIFFRIYTLWPHARVVAAAWTQGSAQDYPHWLASTLVDRAEYSKASNNVEASHDKLMGGLTYLYKNYLGDDNGDVNFRMEDVPSDSAQGFLQSESWSRKLAHLDPRREVKYQRPPLACEEFCRLARVRLKRASNRDEKFSQNYSLWEYYPLDQQTHNRNFALLRIPLIITSNDGDNLKIVLDVFLINALGRPEGLFDSDQEATDCAEDLRTDLQSKLLIPYTIHPCKSADNNGAIPLKRRLTCPRVGYEAVPNKQAENLYHDESVCRLALPKWADFRYRYVFSSSQAAQLAKKEAPKEKDDVGVITGTSLPTLLDAAYKRYKQQYNAPQNSTPRYVLDLEPPSFRFLSEALDRHIPGANHSKTDIPDAHIASEVFRLMLFILCAQPPDEAGCSDDFVERHQKWLKDLDDPDEDVSGRRARQVGALLESVSIERGAILRAATACVADFQVSAAWDPDYVAVARLGKDESTSQTAEEALSNLGKSPYSPYVQDAEEWLLFPHEAKPSEEGKTDSAWRPTAMLAMPLFLSASARPFAIYLLTLSATELGINEAHPPQTDFDKLRQTVPQIANRMSVLRQTAESALGTAYLDDIAECFYQRSVDLFDGKATLSNTRHVASLMTLWYSWHCALPTIGFLIAKGNQIEGLEDLNKKDIDKLPAFVSHFYKDKMREERAHKLTAIYKQAYAKVQESARKKIHISPAGAHDHRDPEKMSVYLQEIYNNSVGFSDADTSPETCVSEQYILVTALHLGSVEDDMTLIAFESRGSRYAADRASRQALNRFASAFRDAWIAANAIERKSEATAAETSNLMAWSLMHSMKNRLLGATSPIDGTLSALDNYDVPTAQRKLVIAKSMLNRTKAEVLALWLSRGNTNDERPFLLQTTFDIILNDIETMVRSAARRLIQSEIKGSPRERQAAIKIADALVEELESYEPLTKPTSEVNRRDLHIGRLHLAIRSDINLDNLRILNPQRVNLVLFELIWNAVKSCGNYWAYQAIRRREITDYHCLLDIHRIDDKMLSVTVANSAYRNQCHDVIRSLNSRDKTNVNGLSLVIQIARTVNLELRIPDLDDPALEHQMFFELKLPTAQE